MFRTHASYTRYILFTLHHPNYFKKTYTSHKIASYLYLSVLYNKQLYFTPSKILTINNCISLLHILNRDCESHILYWGLTVARAEMASGSAKCGTVSSDGRWERFMSLILMTLEDRVEEGVENEGYSASCPDSV